MTTGTLYGVGVGPGDPELITLKAYRLLQSVPVVFAPVARPGGRSMARTIAAPYLDGNRQRLVDLHFAMRSPAGERSAQWRRNAETIAETLDAGQDAVFLTEGDPMLYSTYLHIAGVLRTLRPDLPIVAVPGISSPYAAAALTGTPLADVDERLAVVTATYEGTRVREVLESFHTVVLLKVAPVMDAILDLLEEMNLIDHAVYVRRCGWPEQEVVRDVRRMRGREQDYFSLMIVRRTL